MDAIHVVTNPGIKEANDGDNNKVVLAGKIVNKFESTKDGKQSRICLLTIAITESNGRAPIANYPTVVVFRDRETGASIIDDIYRNDWVKVEGYMSSSYKSRQHRDTYRMQQIVVDKIERQVPTYPEAIGEDKGKPYFERYNRTALKGEVRSITKINDTVTNISIDALHGSVHNTITMSSFGATANKAARELAIGDIVTADCKITTSVKDGGRDNKKVHYQNVIINRIKKESSVQADKAGDAEETQNLEAGKNETSTEN